MKYCGQCGAELKDNAKFCASCGAKCPECAMKDRLESYNPNSKRKPKCSPMIRITAILIVITVGVFVMWWYKSAKQQSEYADGSENHIIVSTDENVSDVRENVEVSTEPEMQTIGDWTLEECQGTTGVYIAHKDGTFSKFYGGGYLEQDGLYNALGMFMRNEILELNPIIGQDDKLVIFCDSSYSFELVPVNWEVGVLYQKLDDGTRGYTLATKNSYGDICFNTYFDNHKTAQNNVTYIDGTPPENYPFEFAQGGPQNTIGCGFPKGSAVKIGVVNGSAIVEETLEVSATYFNCYVKRNIGGVSDNEYFLYPTPTAEGYAVIDMYDGLHERTVPSGTYVMVLRMGRQYIAYLLNWENS